MNESDYFTFGLGLLVVYIFVCGLVSIFKWFRRRIFKIPPKWHKDDATDRQLDYIESLAEERDMTPEQAMQRILGVNGNYLNLTKGEASLLIDELLKHDIDTHD
ncbi:MAG: hypothetical protein OXI60_06560 [Acidiferrobacterales bacterium]|nr:hypothetical protein [Acidiferrobacterales bacterium]